MGNLSAATVQLPLLITIVSTVPDFRIDSATWFSRLSIRSNEGLFLGLLTLFHSSHRIRRVVLPLIQPDIRSVVFAYAGIPFLQMVVPELQNRSPGMMLISMAIPVAFVYSLASVVFPTQSAFFREVVTAATTSSNGASVVVMV